MGIQRNWPPPLDDVLNACPTRALQEIAWCVGSPSLMGSSPGVNHSGQTAAAAARLGFEAWVGGALSAGFDGGSLEQGPSNRRLGHRFETCVCAWFRHHPEWDIKAANHVVQLGKRTAGEIDLLVERAGEVLHLELAVKFYLSTSGSAQWNTWVGVDPVDRLDIKLDKFKAQVALSAQPEVASHLKQFGWEVDQRSVWMKGWFFEHFKRMAAPVLPKDAAPDCNVGWWCHALEWPAIWSAAGDWVAIAPKHWLRVRHNTADVVGLKSAHELPTDLLKNRACMVAMVEREGDVCRETVRGIVVHDRWPQP